MPMGRGWERGITRYRNQFSIAFGDYALTRIIINCPVGGVALHQFCQDIGDMAGDDDMVVADGIGEEVTGLIGIRETDELLGTTEVLPVGGGE